MKSDMLMRGRVAGGAGMGPVREVVPSGYACKADETHIHRALLELARTGPVSTALPPLQGILLTSALCAAARDWAQRS